MKGHERNDGVLPVVPWDRTEGDENRHNLRKGQVASR